MTCEGLYKINQLKEKYDRICCVCRYSGKSVGSFTYLYIFIIA